MVFQDLSSRKQSLMKYILLALSVLGLNLVVIYVLTSILGIQPLLAKLVTEALLFLFSWFMQNRFVFNHKLDKVVN